MILRRSDAPLAAFRLPSAFFLAFLLCGLCALLSGAAARAQEPPQYRFTDIGIFGDRGIVPNDINDAGQVVGAYLIPFDSSPGYSYPRAFRYSNGVLSELATPQTRGARGLAINNSGQIAGIETVSVPGLGGETAYGFIYTPGVGFPPLDYFGDHSWVSADINDRGVSAGGGIVGEQSVFRAFIQENGVVTDIHPAFVENNFSSVDRINNRNQVAGEYSDGRNNRAFFRDADGTALPIPTLGGDRNVIGGLNDNGVVVGFSDIFPGGGTNASTRGFIYTRDGGLTSIDDLAGITTFSSGALDINNKGQIVGYANGSPFLYESGRLYDLTTLILGLPSDWSLSRATGINENGQIIGVASVNGINRAFLLTPVTSAGTAPEPAVLSLVCIGLAIMRMRRRS